MDSFLKIIAVCIISTIAILGVLYDFKVEDKITTSGKMAVVLTILSALTAIIIEIRDIYKNRKDNKERQAQFDNLKYQLSKPILPIKVSYFLKHNPPKESIVAVFAERIKSFKRIIDLHKKDGKFISPDLVGFPFDENYNTTDYILCRLTSEELLLTEEKHSPIKDLAKEPIFFELEFFKKNSQTCDLKMRGGINEGKPPEQKNLDIRLYNSNIYQEAGIINWTVLQNNDTLTSVYDLAGATMKITVFYNSVNANEFNNPPYFTCFRLVCGRGPFVILEFDLEQLGKPIVKKLEQTIDAKINLSEEFKQYFGNPLFLYYEIIIPADDLKNYMREVN